MPTLECLIKLNIIFYKLCSHLYRLLTNTNCVKSLVASLTTEMTGYCLSAMPVSVMMSSGPCNAKRLGGRYPGIETELRRIFFCYLVIVANNLAREVIYTLENTLHSCLPYSCETMQ